MKNTAYSPSKYYDINVLWLWVCFLKTFTQIIALLISLLSWPFQWSKTHLVRTVLWLSGNCTRLNPPAACSTCPPGPGRPGPGPWRTLHVLRTSGTSGNRQLPTEEPCAEAEQTEQRSGWRARSSSASAAPPGEIKGISQLVWCFLWNSNIDTFWLQWLELYFLKPFLTQTCSDTGSSGKYGMFLAHSMVLKRSRAASSQMLSMPMTDAPLTDACICPWL